MQHYEITEASKRTMKKDNYSQSSSLFKESFSIKKSSSIRPTVAAARTQDFPKNSSLKEKKGDGPPTYVRNFALPQHLLFWSLCRDGSSLPLH
jgi:hypothetical protein